MLRHQCLNMFNMKTIGTVLGLLAVASASCKWDDLRVRWEPETEDPSRLSSLYEIPRTQYDAVSADWVEVKDVNSLDVFMYCRKNDPRLCVLLDKKGHVAGFQAGILARDIANMQSIYNLSNIPEYNMKMMFDELVWTSTIYTVNPDIIQTGGRNDCNNLTGSEAIWIERNDGKYVVVPKKLTDLDPIWLGQLCVNEQGKHYYWNMSVNFRCEDSLPWFLLYQDRCLVGGGFQAFGNTTEGERRWHEELTVPIKYIIPDSPQCLTDWIETYGLIYMHFFLIKEPWLYSCPV